MNTMVTTKTKDYGKLVERAILEIQAGGRKPTVANVLHVTGGSKRDIAPAFREAQKRLREQEERRTAIPDMPTELVVLAHDLWVHAYEHSSADFRILQHASHAECQRLEKNVLETEALLATAEIDAETWQGRAEAAEAHADELEARLSTLDTALKVCEARLSEREVLMELFSDAKQAQKIDI